MKDLFDIISEPLVFEEAVKYFEDKIPVKASQFYKLAKKYKDVAFTVSGYTNAQVLKKFHDELTKAIKEGKTLVDFRENINEFLEDKGYKGITAFQADNIFQTNIQTAYQAGHYEQMSNPTVMKLRPIWLYDAVDDDSTRLSHRAMDGRCFRADNPIWDTWYPPNGYRCRCGVTTLSVAEAKRRGLVVETEVPKAHTFGGKFVKIKPDYRFDTNPAKTKFEPDLKGYPDVIVKAYEKKMSSKS